MTTIYAAIDAVRRDGRVDMLDRGMVIEQCRQRGYREAAEWVLRNPLDYAKIVILGSLAVDERELVV